MLEILKNILKKKERGVQAPKELPSLLVENSTEPNEQSSNFSETQSDPEEILSILPTQVYAEQSKPEILKVDTVEDEPKKIDEPQFIDDSIGSISEEVSEEKTYKTQGAAVQGITEAASSFKKEIPSFNDMSTREDSIPINQEPTIAIPMPEVETKMEEEIPAQEAIPTKEEEIQQTQEEEQPVPVQQTQTQEVQGQTDLSGFFFDVGKIMAQEKDTTKLNEFIQNDMFKSMKSYHKNEEEQKTTHLKLSEIEQQVKEKLVHLKVLEDEWLMEKRRLEMQEKLFLEKEEDVYEGIEELKILFSRLDLHKKLDMRINESQYFILKNGQKIESLTHLVKTLKSMSDALYNYHVDYDQDRNDFAQWLEHTYKSNDLARIARKAKSRIELMQLLEEL